MKALSRSVGLLQRTDCRLGGDDWGLYLASEVYIIQTDFHTSADDEVEVDMNKRGPLQWGGGIRELKTVIRRKADMVEWSGVARFFVFFLCVRS